jgi:hypothetical protein
VLLWRPGMGGAEMICTARLSIQSKGRGTRQCSAQALIEPAGEIDSGGAARIGQIDVEVVLSSKRAALPF